MNPRPVLSTIVRAVPTSGANPSASDARPDATKPAALTGTSSADPKVNTSGIRVTVT